MANEQRKEPQLSVIIPVYNGAAYIDACMNMLLTQALPPDEVIFVDDASEDETLSLCHAWQNRMPSLVRVEHLPVNMGPGAARNKGIAVAKGTFLSFIDVDDSLCHQFFAQLTQRILESNAEVSVCGMTIADSNNEQTVLPPKKEMAYAILQKGKILYSPCNKMYRRSFLTENTIYFANCRIGEDMAFAVRLFTLSPKVACVPAALYVYTRRQGSLCSSLELRNEIFVALQEIRTSLHDSGVWRKYAPLYLSLCLLHAVYYPAHLYVTSFIRREHERKFVALSFWRYLLSGIHFLRGGR
jgi:Glycosyltransferases involved in cell wall biogenesis